MPQASGHARNVRAGAPEARQRTRRGGRRRRDLDGLQFVAKWAVDRPRPNLDLLGFLSAHVLSLVVLCGYLAYAVSMGSARRRRRQLLLGVCTGAVGTVAYSRMYLDAHWLSDVLGGLAAGLAYLLISIWVVRSVPLLGRAWRRAPATSGVAAVLVSAPAGSAADSPMVGAAAAMTSPTPASSAG